MQDASFGKLTLELEANDDLQTVMDELVRKDDARQLVILLASGQVSPVTITLCSLESNVSLKHELLRVPVTIRGVRNFIGRWPIIISIPYHRQRHVKTRSKVNSSTWHRQGMLFCDDETLARIKLECLTLWYCGSAVN